MSANRRIPYGYRMINGQMDIHPDEGDVVRRIFREYIGGAALKTIAEHLAREKVEYLPGECGWNKNRVKRILEDSRYAGEEPFAPIIAPKTQAQANKLKESRNTQKDVLMTAEKKRLSYTVLCGACGQRMRHRTDHREKEQESWCCPCGASVKMGIAAIEQHITGLFNLVITEPGRCGEERETGFESSLEIRRLENEIARQTEQPETDQDTVREQILLCAARKYAECATLQHITQRLKADFEKRDLLSDFSIDLYEATADATLLYPDGTIGVRLKNQTLLRKEGEQYADEHGRTEENCAGDTGGSEKSAGIPMG